MKKKSKLIMGLALGAVMATIPLITGCSSDITFNQSDLDNLISNADTYLTAQNNYSSEYAKNVLSDYLIRGISRVSSQEQHYSEKMTMETIDIYGYTEQKEEHEYKIYKNGNNVKEMYTVACQTYPSAGNYTIYREMAEENVAPTNPSTGSPSYNKYTGTTYTEDRDTTDQTQKYTKEDFTSETASIDDICSNPVYTLQYLYSQLLSSVINPEVSFLLNTNSADISQSNIIMEKSGDYEIFKFTKNVRFSRETTSSSGMTNFYSESFFINYIITFKDGVIKSLNVVSTDGEVAETITYEIEENIEDFSFDKTPYQA